MNTSPLTFKNGKVEWTHQTGDSYVVTGRYYNSERRFRAKCALPQQALGINLWNGSVWLIREGKRYRIKQVIN